MTHVDARIVRFRGTSPARSARCWSCCCGSSRARLVWRDPQVLPAPTQAIAAAWRLPDRAGELARPRRREPGAHPRRLRARRRRWASRSASPSGWYAGSRRIVRPLVDLLRPIPPLAWIPIAIVWFGLGEPSKVFVIFLGAFFPIFTNAWRGMTSIPPVLLARGAHDGRRRAGAARSRSRCPPRCPTSRPDCASASASRSASSSPPS